VQAGPINYLFLWEKIAINVAHRLAAAFVLGGLHYTSECRARANREAPALLFTRAGSHLKFEETACNHHSSRASRVEHGHQQLPRWTLQVERGFRFVVSGNCATRVMVNPPFAAKAGFVT